MIWLAFAVLTIVVLAVLLWPAAKPEPVEQAADRSAYDRAVFRDQLAELDRDVARGAIGEREAEAARNEISRRLIGANAEVPGPARPPGFPVIALIAALLVPAAAVPLYLVAGNPSLPDVPLAARMEKAIEAGDFAALIVKVEKHLAENPGDEQGWRVLAPAYQRARRWSDAANAYVNILRLSPPDAVTLADYAEVLVFANNGMVTAEAHRIIAAALKLDARLPKARFFDALALKQEGRTGEARKAFETFLAESPADAPWRPMVEAELNDLATRPPEIAQDAVESASGMSAADQQDMIRGMVERLDEKLKADAGDLDGWLRLIRARSVLNETDKATAAYRTAKHHFKDNVGALTALDGLAKELNIP